MSGVDQRAEHGLGVLAAGLVRIYRSEDHDVAALAGVTLAVAPGEVVGLLGPSGSGKSTLLQTCAGLVAPSAGRLLVGGADLARLPAAELDRLRATRMGVLLQGASRNLLPFLTARENVAFAQAAAAAAGSEPAMSADDALALVGLTEPDQAPPALSAGHRQLLAIATAIAHRPGLVLADEPTSRLDHAARDRVLATLMRVNEQLGTTVVLVTHDPDVAAMLPRTVTIRDGRIGAEGRAGQEYAVVTADGSVPLPPEVLELAPPGTLLQVRPTEDGLRLTRVDEP